MNKPYYDNPNQYSRYKTREVKIGRTYLGGEHPIRIQSMTNTDTNNIEASVNQCIRIFEAGADYVRLTTQGLREVENLMKIRKILNEKGYTQPLIADVHFNPRVAELSATIVEKVRINPGNYADRRSSYPLETYTDEEYKDELVTISHKLIPLIAVCKKHYTALRIGINHGSLSDRIMSRYGDTPLGMVESALEFIRICRNEHFDDIVVSMKSSNTRIMVQAYRLLISIMKEEGMNYPLHLGVTEAGEGEDGRIRSAVGIGALLTDGIGDTIRVSLTEEPEFEIPVAKKIVNHFENTQNHQPIKGYDTLFYNPYEFSRRKTNPVLQIGGNHVPIVIIEFNENNKDDLDFPKGMEPEYVVTRNVIDLPESFQIPVILNYFTWLKAGRSNKKSFPIFTPVEFIYASYRSDQVNFITVSNDTFSQEMMDYIGRFPVVFILETMNVYGYGDQRAFINRLISEGWNIPVIIKRNYVENDIENLQVKAACDIGTLFIDGLGDGIWISNNGNIKTQQVVSTSFSILQASRVRTSKTEFISCPGCGRTLFNLQETVRKVKEKTSHLTGLKIAVMGCIVNGPGEMADADYGYVGAGHGKINLYKTRTLVKRNISEELAINELIELIKLNGDWKDT